MISSLNLRPDRASIEHLQDLLRIIDPGAKVVLDADSGEVRARGQFDADQLGRAVDFAGLRVRPLLVNSEGCCGSCGCG